MWTVWFNLSFQNQFVDLKHEFNKMIMSCIYSPPHFLLMNHSIDESGILKIPFMVIFSVIILGTTSGIFIWPLAKSRNDSWPTKHLQCEGSNSQTGHFMEEATKAIALHAPWSLPWCPWKAPVELYNLIECPAFTKEKMHGFPCPFKNKPYSPEQPFHEFFN